MARYSHSKAGAMTDSLVFNASQLRRSIANKRTPQPVVSYARMSPTSSLEDDFVLVGRCSVYGMMNGEMMQKIRDGKIHLQGLNLR